MTQGSITFMPIDDSMVNPGRPHPLTCLEVSEGDDSVTRLILEPDDLESLARACAMRREGLKRAKTVVFDSEGVSTR